MDDPERDQDRHCEDETANEPVAKLRQTLWGDDGDESALRSGTPVGLGAALGLVSMERCPSGALRNHLRTVTRA